MTLPKMLVCLLAMFCLDRVYANTGIPYFNETAWQQSPSFSTELALSFSSPSVFGYVNMTDACYSLSILAPISCFQLPAPPFPVTNGGWLGGVASANFFYIYGVGSIAQSTIGSSTQYWTFASVVSPANTVQSVSVSNAYASYFTSAVGTAVVLVAMTATANPNLAVGSLTVLQTSVFPPVQTMTASSLPASFFVAVSDDAQTVGWSVLSTGVITVQTLSTTWTLSISNPVSGDGPAGVAQLIFVLSNRYIIASTSGPGYPCNIVFTLTDGQWISQTICYPNLIQVAEPILAWVGVALLDDTYLVSQTLLWFAVNQSGPGQWGLIAAYSDARSPPCVLPAIYSVAPAFSWYASKPARYAIPGAAMYPQSVYVGLVGCGAGTFFNATDSQCTPCAAGSYNLYVAMSSCAFCPDGTTSLAGSSLLSACTACLPGYYCTNGTVTPCPAGTYNAVGAGKSLVDCALCPDGTASSSLASTACTVCAAGSAAPPGSSSCEQCVAGTYATAEGQGGCSQCLQGRYSTTVGATSGNVCIPCPAGTFNPNVASSSAAACQPCPNGTFSTQVGSPLPSICTPCDAGFYGPLQGQANKTACIPCPPGSYAQYQLSTSCTPCPKGTFSTIGGNQPSICLSCPMGTYADSTGQSVCTDCAAGSYSNATGSTSASACQLCPAGMFSQVTGATGFASCHVCLDGTFSATAGVSVCSTCPLGTFGISAGATTNATCSPCQAGSYGASSGLSTCTLCPFNSYSNKVSATVATVCTPCPAGLGTMSQGSINALACVQCPLGYWYSPVSGCNACQAGTWSSTTNATSSSVCINCAAGTFSTAAAATAQSTCVSCGPGARSGVGATTCGSCPTGQTSGTTVNSCVACASGTYGSSAGVCTPCPPGYVSPAGATVCGPCPAGSYQDGPSCILCEPGTYQTNTSSSACLACAAGTYSAAVGQMSASTCSPCGFGVYSTATGASSSDVCKACLPGTYQNVTGASSSAACLPCPANTWSNTSAAGSASVCRVCPPGAQCYVGAQQVEQVTAPSILATGGAVQTGAVYGSDVAARSDFAFRVTGNVNAGQVMLDMVILGVALAVVVAAAFVGLAACRVVSLEGILAAIDFVFPAAHRTAPGKSIVPRKTPLGGLMTMTLFGLVVLVLSYLIAQFAMYNQSVLSTVVAGQMSMSASTNLTVSVQAAAYGGECNPNSTALQPTYAGILISNPPTYSVTYFAANRTCAVTWQCSACVVSTPASVTVSFAETNAAAAMLQWQVSATPIFVDETNIVRGFVQSTSTAAVLRGAAPTNVQISAFNTLFTNAYNIRLAGVRLFNGSISPGPLQTAQSYYHQSGLSVLFDLQLFVGYAQVTILAPITWVNLFTSIFSLCGAVFTVAGLAMALLEVIIARVYPHAGFISATDVPGMDTGSKHDHLRSPSSQASVMANPLYRAPAASPTELVSVVAGGSELAPPMTQKGGHGVVIARATAQPTRGGYDDL